MTDDELAGHNAMMTGVLTWECILAMPAGMALDALVAERVMGQHRTGDCSPRYSTDIAAAWEVVKKIGSPVEMYYFQSGQLCLVKLPMYNEIEVESVSMPLSICLAALLSTLGHS